MATTEVADHLLMVDSVEEANVYGVKVPGKISRQSTHDLQKLFKVVGLRTVDCVASSWAVSYNAI